MPSDAGILGLIPARGGSKGVPRKNVKLLAGKPLIEYTIEAALKSKFLDVVACSTDDEEIAAVARQAGAEVPFLRPAELASDTAKAIGVIQHALNFFEQRDGRIYDPVVYLEPPAPFRTTEDIDRSISLYLAKTPDSVVSVYEANHFHPAYMKKIEGDRLLPFCLEEVEGQPRQLYEPKAYLRNGAVYVFSRKNILDGKLYGAEIVPYVMPWERSICIDDMIDWFTAEAVFKLNAHSEESVTARL